MLYDTPNVTSLRFTSTVETQGDPSTLRFTGMSARTDDFQAHERHLVDVEIENRADRVWALPRPVRPLKVRARWRPRGGGAPSPWRETRIMLPLALAAHQRDLVPVVVEAPPADCDGEPELEIPELGWTLRTSEIPGSIDRSARPSWTRVADARADDGAGDVADRRGPPPTDDE